MGGFVMTAASALGAVMLWRRADQMEQDARQDSQRRTQAAMASGRRASSAEPAFISPFSLASAQFQAPRPTKRQPSASPLPFSPDESGSLDAFFRRPAAAAPKGAPPEARAPEADALRSQAMAQAEAQAARMESRAMAVDADTQAHEAAHQSQGGHLAGGIHLDYATESMTMPDGSTRSVTYANAGSVPIAMPSAPTALPSGPDAEAQLSRIQSDLRIAEAAALAPGSGLSSADAAIASQAAAMATQTESLIQTAKARPTLPPAGNPFLGAAREPAPSASGPNRPDFSQLAPMRSVLIVATPAGETMTAPPTAQTRPHSLTARPSLPAAAQTSEAPLSRWVDRVAAWVRRSLSPTAVVAAGSPAV